MYTASTLQLGRALGLPFLEAIPQYTLYVALLIWVLIFLWMIVHLGQALTMRPKSEPLNRASEG